MAAIANRLKMYLDFKNLNYREADEFFGFSNGLSGKFVAGKTTLGVDKIEKILSACPDLNGDWLITGRGEMVLNNVRNGKPQSKKKAFQVNEGEIERARGTSDDFEKRLQDKDETIAALKETVKAYQRLLNK